MLARIINLQTIHLFDFMYTYFSKWPDNAIILEIKINYIYTISV